MESSVNFTKRIRKTLSPLKKLTFKLASASFAVSHYTKRILIQECNISPDSIGVTYNGVNYKKFIHKEKSTILSNKYNPECKFVFLTLTRLDDYKGIDYTIKAISSMKTSNLKYLVCGEGRDLERLQALTKTLKLESVVEFIGKVDDKDLIDFYNLADCFILASREDLITPNVEGFGIVYLEAAACENLIIAGDSGGVIDAVGAENTAILVDPTNIEEIASAMMSAMSNNQENLAMKKNARKRVEKSFSWDDVTNRLLHHLNCKGLIE